MMQLGLGMHFNVHVLMIFVELEEMFGCVVVQKLLQGDVDFRSMKKVIMQKDHMSIQKCKDKA